LNSQSGVVAQGEAGPLSQIERLVELYAPEGAAANPLWDFVSPEWAHSWPAEEIWVARKL